MNDLSPLILSLYVATIALAIVATCGVLLARITLTLPKPWCSILESILTLPLLLPPSVIGFFLLILLGDNSGLGRMLERLDIQLIFTPEGAILAAVIVALPLMYRAAYGAFLQVDKEMLWAARTMGLGEWTILVKILIPQASAGLLSGIILAFARGLGEFGATLMVAGNIPGKTQTMSTVIYFAATSGRVDVAMVWSLVMFGISFGMLIFLNKYQKRGY